MGNDYGERLRYVPPLDDNGRLRGSDIPVYALCGGAHGLRGLLSLVPRVSSVFPLLSNIILRKLDHLRCTAVDSACEWVTGLIIVFMLYTVALMVCAAAFCLSRGFRRSFRYYQISSFVNWITVVALLSLALGNL